MSPKVRAGAYRACEGARWGVGGLHKVLTRPTFKGEFHFNLVTAKTKMAKPDSEHIIVPVEAIIDPAVFNVVQTSLECRNPRVTSPRVATGPILLTGIAT